MLKTEIPFPSADGAAQLFARVAGRPWSIWLDSGTGDNTSGRYDIIVAEPSRTLVTQGGNTWISVTGGEGWQSDGEPLDLLRSVLAEHPGEQSGNIPFSGGAIGYFSYDLARRFERLPTIATDDLSMPEMVVGIYDWAVVCDRKRQQCWLVSAVYRDESEERWQRLIELFCADDADSHVAAPMSALTPATSNLSYRTYSEAFTRIQHYLAAGDCYQVNFAQRFTVDVTGDPWAGYRQLRSRGAGPFSAYLNLPYGQILCTSPERFLRVDGQQVETRPIKGTRPRGCDAKSDQRLREALLASKKDRAENLMIVDLLRNDLGKSCRTGSVRVPELFSVESYATVHHLVSSITCELDDESDALSLLRGCFPGGSITGAPKLRAMEIIEELEPHRRGVYCGAIGYIGFDGNMDSNIVIRTAIHKDAKLYYSAGGGVVRDSSCEEEYQESFDKAAAFLRCFARGVEVDC